MPYLQVDLDGKRKWPMVAAGCGISEAQVCKGFLDLWESCWRAKNSSVSILYLECLFEMPGRGERCAEVLCAFGFLESHATGYRISGAEKYLRVQEARSANGKKAAANGNLKRGKVSSRPTKTSSIPPEIPNSAPVAPQQPSSSAPVALQPLHPTPNTIHPEVKSIPPEAAAEEPGRFNRLKAKLVGQFEASTKSKYGWQRGDPAALKILMGYGTDDEIQARLANGLKATGYQHTASISQLASKWNEPGVRTGTGPPGKATDIRKSPVRAEDVNQESFKEVGRVEF